jgi:hypothetical protein
MDAPTLFRAGVGRTMEYGGELRWPWAVWGFAGVVDRCDPHLCVIPPIWTAPMMRVCVLCLLFVATLYAVAGVGEARTWTDATGKHTTEAEFVEAKGGKVTLRKKDGSVVTIALERLSRGDRKYVADRVRAASAEKRPAAEMPEKPAGAKSAVEGIQVLQPRMRGPCLGGKITTRASQEVVVCVMARGLPPKGRHRGEAGAYFYLPPTTDHQTVHRLVCVPPADKISSDTWGNEIAYCSLGRPQPGDCPLACWMARVTLSDLAVALDRAAPAPSEEQVQEAKRLYLSDSPMYMLSSPTVKRIAGQMQQGGTGPEQVARAIHEYLSKHIVYDRVGGHDNAAIVLERGNGSCSEYAYSWIALARSCGIPARYTGSMRCGGGDHPSYDIEHHRWAEIFLPRWGWIPVNKCEHEFQQFLMSKGLLQLCWCGEGEPPMGWGYVGRSVGAAMEFFACPASLSGDWDGLVRLTRDVFAAKTSQTRFAVLAKLESRKTADCIPLLYALLYAPESKVAFRAARKIVALDERAAAQVRSMVGDDPQSQEAVNEVLSDSIVRRGGWKLRTTWLAAFNGRNLDGWTGDLKRFQVGPTGIVSRGRGGRILAPYCAGRWYQAEWQFTLGDDDHLQLVLADTDWQRMEIPVWTEKNKVHNSVNGRHWGYAARPGGRHTALVTVADDHVLFDFDGKRVMDLRHPQVGPGLIGIATGADQKGLVVHAIRIRAMTRKEL